jgi:predicted metal-binding protein
MLDNLVETENKQHNTLFVCDGCCCGHPEKGNPVVERDNLKELIKEEGLKEQISLQFPYCLGPCSLANVVKARIKGKDFWFKQINTETERKAVVSFVKNPTQVPQTLKEKQVFFN